MYIKKCPFCKNLMDDSDVLEFFAFDGTVYYVCCENCGASGSAKTSKEEAIKMWNKRE